MWSEGGVFPMQLGTGHLVDSLVSPLVPSSGADVAKARSSGLDCNSSWTLQTRQCYNQWKWVFKETRRDLVDSAMSGLAWHLIELRPTITSGTGLNLSDRTRPSERYHE